MKISVLIKDPGKKPRHVNISNTLKNLQSIVGGRIEVVTLCTDWAIICNEEAQLLLDLPYNCNFCGVDLVGTIILVGVNGDEFVDLPYTYADARMLLPQLWKEAER